MNNILTVFERNEEIKTLIESTTSNSFNYYVTGCGEHHQYLLTYATYLKSGSFVIYIAPNVYKANLAYEAFCKLAGHENVNLYVTDEIISTELVAVSQEFKQERMSTIKSILKNEKKIIVTHVLAALKTNINKKSFQDYVITLKKDDIINVKEIIKKLIYMGYEKVPTTTKLGEFSVRGEVIDVYPSCMQNPIRINLFDDEIEKIREYDYQTQLGKKEIKEIEIYPINEIVVEDNLKIEQNILKACEKENEIISRDLEDFKNYQNVERMNKYIKYIDSNNESILEYVGDKIVIFDNLSNLKKAYEQLNIDLGNYLEQTNFPKNLELVFFYDFERILLNQKQIYCSEFKTGLSGVKLDRVFDIYGYDVINYDHNLKILINELKEKASKTVIITISTK